MISKVETMSGRPKMPVIILYATLGISTTLYTGGMSFENLSSATEKNVSSNDMGTSTLKPLSISESAISNIERARSLFPVKMREMTEKESETYNLSLKKIYKPTGVNIFDIC